MTATDDRYLPKAPLTFTSLKSPAPCGISSTVARSSWVPYKSRPNNQISRIKASGGE